MTVPARRRLALPACLLTHLVACQSPAADEGAARIEADAGAVPVDEGGPPSVGPLGVRASDEARFGTTVDGATPDDPGAVAACWDMVPEDATIDCADPECLALRSCCVGDGDCCAPVAASPLPAAFDATRCADGDAADCARRVGAAVAFGAPAPSVEAGRVFPGGGLEGEGGLWLGEPVDLRQHRVEIDVVFGAAAACAPPCVEAVGVALVPDPGDAVGRPPRPIAALVHVVGADEVRLLVGDQVVAEAADPGPERTVWTLVAEPDGRLLVLRDGVAIEGVPITFAPPGPARLVLEGRNASAPRGTGASVTRLAARVAVCDIPSAWSTRALIDLRAPGGDPVPAAATFGPPSLAHWTPDESLLALTIDGAVRVARRGRGDPSTRFTSSAGDALGAAAGAHEVAGREDPELLVHEGGVALFYTAFGSDGAASVARADAPDGRAFTPRPAPVVAPDGVEVLGLDAPTAAVAFDGTWVLVARATLADGAHALRVFTSIDGGERFAPLQAPRLAALTRGLGDALESASLHVHNGAWQLYVVRRDGARHRVALLVSDDLLFWREVTPRALEGGAGPLDRLGVRGLDAAARGDLVEAVHLLVGEGGARPALAARPSPAFCERAP